MVFEAKKQSYPDFIRNIKKAKLFYTKITVKEDFSASSGFLDKFQLWHGIRQLKICGEEVSSEKAEMDLSEEQLYNANESAAFCRVLPGNTCVHTKEKLVPVRNISKDCVTFMPCSNAAGTHKLPLLVIGKSANPRAFKGYKNSSGI